MSWKPLTDAQWMNIVNHDRAWESYSKDDAVHEAVKMTEAKCKENNEAKLTAANERIRELEEVIRSNERLRVFLDSGWDAANAKLTAEREVSDKLEKALLNMKRDTWHWQQIRDAALVEVAAIRAKQK